MEGLYREVEYIRFYIYKTQESLFVHSGVQLILTICVTCRVSYKRQELPIPRSHLSSPPFFGGFVLIIVLVFCVVFFVLCLVIPILALSLDCYFLLLRFSLTFIFKLLFPAVMNIS